MIIVNMVAGVTPTTTTTTAGAGASAAGLLTETNEHCSLIHYVVTDFLCNFSTFTIKINSTRTNGSMAEFYNLCLGIFYPKKMDQCCVKDRKCFQNFTWGFSLSSPYSFIYSILFSPSFFLSFFLFVHLIC